MANKCCCPPSIRPTLPGCSTSSGRRCVARRLKGKQTGPSGDPMPTMLTFDSDREGPDGLYWKPVDAGPGGVERLASGSGEYHKPSSWSPDGKKLAFVVLNAETEVDIWIVPRNGEAEPFLRTRFNEAYPEFSPDGRWLVYSSDESGTRRGLRPSLPWPWTRHADLDGGRKAPGWSRDGSEVFYRWQRDFFFAVPITIDGENLRPGTPVKLFDWSYFWAGPVRSWDVAPDGRFLVTGKTTDTDVDRIRDRSFPTASRRLELVRGAETQSRGSTVEAFHSMPSWAC